jgi:hypothetical protein
MKVQVSPENSVSDAETQNSQRKNLETNLLPRANFELYISHGIDSRSSFSAISAALRWIILISKVQ